MASRTDDYGIPLVVAGQAQPEVTLAIAERMRQALVCPANEQRNDPPLLPTNGDIYVCGDNPTGAWSEWPNKIVTYYAGTWYAVPDVDDGGADIPIGLRHFGLKKFVQYIGAELLWDGSAWVPA